MIEPTIAQQIALIIIGIIGAILMFKIFINYNR